MNNVAKANAFPPKAFTLVSLVLLRADRMLTSVQSRRRIRRTDRLDKTGRVVKAPEKLIVQEPSDGVRFVNYPHNLAHSMWRSQELSLLTRHSKYLEHPRLDFGCGDGSFGSALFDRIDYGIDYDAEALNIARGFAAYDHLMCSDGACIPLCRASVQSVFSNSVLEHVEKLQDTVLQLREILRPSGYLVFTVPVLGFAEHLTRYLGRHESDSINQQWYHRNLQSAQAWRELLSNCGFTIAHMLHYQPDWFTLMYFALSTRPMRWLGNSRVIEGPGFQKQIGKMIARSFASPGEGANIFVVAQR